MKGFHFIGVGGIGMSALAHLLLDRGVSVSGSDKNRSEQVERLIEKGLHFTSHFSDQAQVVYSSAIPKEHPERVLASSRGQSLLHRSDLLKQLSEEKRALAVCGTHGKSSTSAMLTHLLFPCSYALGAILREEKVNACFENQSPFFVFEADESDGTHEKYDPEGLILTNCEAEHLDHYGSERALFESIERFAKRVKSLVFCDESPLLSQMALKGLSYGRSSRSALFASNYRPLEWGASFDLHFEGKSYSQVELPLLGEHQLLNFLGAFGLAALMGEKPEALIEKIATYKGIKRRMEPLGTFKGAFLVDDYAHHPTEIEATLRACIALKKRRVIALYEPHRYSRTVQVLNELQRAFELADHVFVTPIYSAGESALEGVSEEILLQRIGKKATLYSLEALQAFLEEGDLLLVMGAGRSSQLAHSLVESCEKVTTH